MAVSEGIGSALLEVDPQQVKEMVGGAVRILGHKPFSVKIRLHNDIKKTISLARQLEHCGIGWLTVHGRTRFDRSSVPVDLESIRLINETLKIPVVANGDIFTLEDAERVFEKTGCQGVMAARGLLENPMLFAGKTDRLDRINCAYEYLNKAISYGTTTCVIEHHIGQMTKGLGDKSIMSLNLGIPAIESYLKSLKSSIE